MKPTVGIIVMYNVPFSIREALNNHNVREYSKFPAIIIGVSANPEHKKNEVDLHIFNNVPQIQGAFIIEDCPQGDEEAQWNWPEIKK